MELGPISNGSGVVRTTSGVPSCQPSLKRGSGGKSPGSPSVFSTRSKQPRRPKTAKKKPRKQKLAQPYALATEHCPEKCPISWNGTPLGRSLICPGFRRFRRRYNERRKLSRSCCCCALSALYLETTAFASEPELECAAIAVARSFVRPSCRKYSLCPRPQRGAVRNSFPVAEPCVIPSARPAPMLCTIRSE